MKLLIKPLSEKIGREIPLPYYATAGAAALDLHACLDEAVTLPAGHVGIMAVRSSMGVRNGVCLSNGIGVIDSDYRGPLQVALHNMRGTAYTIQPGDRIAQLMVVPVARPEVELTASLPETARGEGGFGSTGR